MDICKNDNNEKSTENSSFYVKLLDLINNNVEFFNNDNQLKNSLRLLNQSFHNVAVSASEVKKFAHLYDFDKSTPGNGYRSFLSVFYSAVNHLTELLCKITANREKYLFNKATYVT